MEKRAGRKSQITIRQLLNFTDGIEPAPHLHRESIRDRNAMAIRLSIPAEPGSAFTYGPSHLQIFSELLRRKLNGRSTFAYLEGHVLDPLGLNHLEYKKDRRGNPLLATGFKLTAREWARLGELVLGHGNYHGRQIVLGVCWRRRFSRIDGQSILRPHVLVESSGAHGDGRSTSKKRSIYHGNARVGRTSVFAGRRRRTWSSRLARIMNACLSFPRSTRSSSGRDLEVQKFPMRIFFGWCSDTKITDELTRPFDYETVPLNE